MVEKRLEKEFNGNVELIIQRGEIDEYIDN
jgi:hypothetical protein